MELVGATARRWRWWIVALICAGTIANYLARNSLGVLAPQLEAAFAMSTQQYSYVVGAFQLAYTVMQPVAGLVVDRTGLRAGFAAFGVAWSAANMLSSLAGGWATVGARTRNAAMASGLVALEMPLMIPACGSH